MNFRATPFVRLLLPFVAGITLSQYIAAPHAGLELLVSAALLLTCIASFFQYDYAYRAIYGAILHIGLIGIGYVHGIWHNELTQNHHFTQTPGNYIVGTIYDAPGKTATRVKAPISLEARGTDPDHLTPCSGNILLFIAIDSTAAVHYGDRVLIRTTPRPSEPPQNPNSFDYGRYLHFQNIHYQAFVKKDSITILSGEHGYRVWRMAFYCRYRLLEILRSHFGDGDEYAVASALLVGYKDDLSDDLRTAYAETGSMHALAVSGTHVAFLYIGLMYMLARIRWNHRYRKLIEMGILLLAIWAFTFLTGASASVLRASVMFSIYLLGKSLFQSTTVWNVLAASAFILLVYNPYFLFDAGFQLSYTAVAGMVFFYPLFWKNSPAIRNKIIREAWSVLLVGFAAQLGTLPLSLYYFHQFPCYFWLSGWVVIAVGAVFMGAGALLIVLDWCSTWLAGLLGKLLFWMLWCTNVIISAIQHLPGSVITGIWLTTSELFLLYGIIAAFAVAWVRRRKRLFFIGMSGLTLLLLGHTWRSIEQSHQQEIVVYAVHKSRLIDCFDGHQAYILSDTLTPKQEKFAAQSNRWAHGVQSEAHFNFKDTLITPHIWYKAPLLQVGSYRMAIIDGENALPARKGKKIKVDTVVLSKNAGVSKAECLQYFEINR